MPSEKANYTVAEAAAAVGITEKAVRQRIFRGEFPHRRWGRKVIIPRAELEKFLQNLPGVSAEEAVVKNDDKQSTD